MNLNENQKRHLVITFKHIDKMLSDAEQVLSSERSGSLFLVYFFDVAPETAKIFKQGATEFRALMSKILKRLNIPPQPPGISALRAALTTLTFVDNALEELKSRYMRGYGALSREAAEALDDQIGQMQNVIARIKERTAHPSA